MCNALDCPHGHDDLNDDLEDIFGAGLPSSTVDDSLVVAQTKGLRMFNTKCKACKGSGRFVSYTGRVVGSCFKCKGKGTIATRTDPAELEKRRAQAAARKAQKQLEAAQAATEWREEHKAEGDWLVAASARGFEFAQSLSESLLKFGSLSPNQLAAVRKCIEKDEARRAEKAARIESAPKVDISAAVAALELARQNGLEWPKLRLGEFTLSRAGDSGKNAGSVYVKAGDTYLGRITDGAFIRSRDCSDELEAAILELCAQPLESAIAYGRQTGRCSCCGRKLTDATSVERGIGPICAEKFFGG